VALSGGLDLPLWPALSRIQIGLLLVCGFAPQDFCLWHGHEMLHGVRERFVFGVMLHTYIPLSSGNPYCDAAVATNIKPLIHDSRNVSPAFL
jgi:hypothetical protein